jgi:hypothetical protein
MNDLILMPDVERLLSAWLREQIELTDLTDDRIYTSVPSRPEFPLLRVYRLGGIPLLDQPLWIDDAFMQFDAWGGPKATAWEIAETTRALLASRFVGVHPEGIVANVKLGELRYEPDAEYTPAKPRYLFTATIRVHPVVPIGS